MYDVVLDRITILSDFATRACQEPSCGTRDEDGVVVSCHSVNCGEKRMEPSLQRELRGMRYMRELIEGLETAEFEKRAAEDKRGK